MSAKHTIVMNGKVYDAITGLPAAAPAPIAQLDPVQHEVPAPVDIPVVHASHTHSPAPHAHHQLQKSQTLLRAAVKRPTPTAQHSLRRRPTPHNVPHSDMIKRFAPHPKPIQKRAQIQHDIVRPERVSHVVAQKQALTHAPVAASVAAQSSRSLKEQLISERLASIDTSRRDHHVPERPKRKLFSNRSRFTTTLTACIALVFLGGYLTYLNMPNLSVRVAAAQAGVNASYPQYHPDGYRFNGPIAYSSGEVAVKFQANGGTSNYTVKQQESSWNSQAVYDNLVAKQSTNGGYTANSESGLTIYTYGNKAAWVNSGILYTIDGSAPLSSDQLLKIAASM